MQVQDIMTRNPACCAPDTALVDVARLMAEHDCGEIPVIANAKPIGVITDRDIVCRVVARGNVPTAVAADFMTSPVVTVTPETSLEDCCVVLERHQIRRVPIVDAKGEIFGIVSQADIAQRAPEALTGAMVREVSTPSSRASAV